MAVVAAQGMGGIVVNISGGTINGSSSEFKQSIREAVIEGVSKKRNLSSRGPSLWGGRIFEIASLLPERGA
jgi:hypothetical protein